jgi:putative phosphonate metabolism protein
MSEQGPRYAIYYAPDVDDPLWRFGCECIGYDAEAGTDCPVPQSPLISRDDWLVRTQEPRRYGFHATLKAPFHLAEGRSEAELIENLAQFSCERKSVSLVDLDVRAIDRFAALTLLEPNQELQALARDCVTHFDGFRAPIGKGDLARRLASPLSERQKELLQAWGYPYVMEQFRFHMTLTSSLPDSEIDVIVAELARRYQEQVGHHHHLIQGVALFRQETRESRFRLTHRFSFITGCNSPELT